MKRRPSLIELAARMGESIQAMNVGDALSGEDFNALALELFQVQFTQVAAYRRLCERRNLTPDEVSRWEDVPAVPTTGFKEFDFTSLPPKERTRVFHSSGTTNRRPSRHFHWAGSLALYEASLEVSFRRHLLPDFGASGRPGFLALTPAPAAAPHSSLVHMFGTLVARQRDTSSHERFAASVAPDGGWRLRTDEALAFLRDSIKACRPVCLLGPAFAYVHLLEALEAGGIALRLPPGSRLMETGGYKGRSREVARDELRAWLTRRLGVAPECIVGEYGMSELSSQAYDHVAGQPLSDGPVVFHFPPWARVRVVSPETGGEVAEGGAGLVQVFDLTNVWSVMAVETGDLARRRGNGFELLGRATQAEPRGCSLMPTDGNPEEGPP